VNTREGPQRGGDYEAELFSRLANLGILATYSSNHAYLLGPDDRCEGALRPASLVLEPQALDAYIARQLHIRAREGVEMGCTPSSELDELALEVLYEMQAEPLPLISLGVVWKDGEPTWFSERADAGEPERLPPGSAWVANLLPPSDRRHE